MGYRWERNFFFGNNTILMKNCKNINQLDEIVSLAPVEQPTGDKIILK
jgi:hypothetical protein